MREKGGLLPKDNIKAKKGRAVRESEAGCRKHVRVVCSEDCRVYVDMLYEASVFPSPTLGVRVP